MHQGRAPWQRQNRPRRSMAKSQSDGLPGNGLVKRASNVFKPGVRPAHRTLTGMISAAMTKATTAIDRLSP